MAGSDPDTSKITDREDVLWFLETADILLPEGLTVEKIRDRRTWWVIEDEAFSFRLERHPSGMFWSTSPTGGGQPTPARWHVRKRYRYDHETGEWEITELDREFDFNPGLLIDAEFERMGRKAMWDEAITRVQTADDPETVLTEEFAVAEDFYRELFPDVPEEQFEEMLAVLRQAFRQRAGCD